MKLFHTPKEVLMASPVGQSLLFMLQQVQPVITAFVPMNEYTIVYAHPEGGTLTMQMDYKEVLELYKSAKIMKDAGELHYFDETSVDYVM